MTNEDIEKAIVTMLPVRMTQAFKDKLKAQHVMLCCADPKEPQLSDPTHLEEFGECQGFVVGWVEYLGGIRGPEVDVYWQPDNLHYGYMPEDLEWAD